MFGFGPTITSLIILLIALYFPLRHFYYTRGAALLVSFGVCLAIFLLLLVLPQAVVAYAYIPLTACVLLSIIYTVWRRLRG